MEYQPPPFFKRGPAPLALLTLYVAIAVTLLVLDARLHTLELLRQTIGTLTHPLQVAAQQPLRLLEGIGERLQSASVTQDELARVRREHLERSAEVLRTQQLEAENTHLRELLGLAKREEMAARAASVVRTARDPFSLRIVVDKGTQDDVVAGQPVIDDKGVVGQVTRVFPFVSEVTLITDKDQAVPVQIVRNGLRSVVFGTGGGRLELRFLPASADVQEGDILVTSGLDGVFLPGIPVAKIERIESDSVYAFARIHCVPTAGVENFSEVMLLAPRKANALPAELGENGRQPPGERQTRARKKHASAE
ncbi:rod shape-determining protein MreC [Rhodocyclus purpureus]|uniref:rod shape-determining protein MreC n=1 Tax=Rhodocyclus purpureus TaxID=1067 RepID=UPI0019134EF1|nr:rod shape-determining protein MreC [Rhodocyclus purpureus]MBK5913962.1 rod shape-determining protein MreC [Rhodocyclus purpureus]